MSRRFLSIVVVCLLPVVIGAISCTPQCDYPESRVAKLRLVNTMPDQDAITVWLNGRLFKKDYLYDPPSADFGYFTQYEDGSSLGIGKTVVVVTSDAAGKDTIYTDTVVLNLHRQTLVIVGRAHTKLQSEKNTKNILLLDDEGTTTDPEKTLVRFIHAVPDLPTLDVNWDSTNVPNATLAYGENITQYFDLTVNKRVLITEAGNPNNVIALIPYKFPSKSFFVTVIIRGRTKPVGNEHVVSTFLLSDVEVGNYILNFKTFGVRLMNTSRDQTLSLLIRSPSDAGIRSNYPLQQNTLMDIPHDSASAYIALNPLLNKQSTYYYSKNHDVPNLNILDSVAQTADVDQRFTFVTVEKTPFGQGGTSLDHLVLRDSTTCPSDTNFTRVRVVMVTPDHPSISVTFGGTTVVMPNKDVKFFDVPVGSQALQLSDGTLNRTVQVPINRGRPMTVYLLPRQAGEQFPIKAVVE